MLTVYTIGLWMENGCLMLPATRFLLQERTVLMVQTENLVQMESRVRMALTVLTDSRALPERMELPLSLKLRMATGIFHMITVPLGSSLVRRPARTERMVKTVRTERTAKMERMEWMEWMVIPCSRMWMPAILIMCCSYSATAPR